MATFGDTADLFQIIILSWSDLSSRGDDGEEDVYQRNLMDLTQSALNSKRAELVL